MDRIRLRFGGYQKPASIHNRAAAHFGELLQRDLGTRLEFELVGDVLALGHNSGELPAMVERGELSMCYMSSVRFVDAVPELRLLELPFTVRNRAALFTALDGPLGERFRARLHAGTNFRLLGFWDNGFRHLSNKVRPIRRPEDCHGIRIRTQMSELHVAVFRALGFEPIAADVKEFVEQIATDRFQAQDNPLTNIYNFGVHHHHRYITLSGHLFGASLMICNAETYARWPREVQAAVERAAAAATRFQHELAAAEDAAMLAKFDPRESDIVRLTAAEHAEFVAAVEPVLEQYRGELDPELFRYLA